MNNQSLTLYKLTPTNLLVWSIHQLGCLISISYGIDGGQLQTTTLKCITEEEATQVYKTKSNKKRDREGYTTGVPTTQPKLPMLAQPINLDSLPQEVFVQPKLDGVRCTANYKEMKSRQNTPIYSLPHIRQALKKLPRHITLDGELYCHGWNLQQILSVVKRDSYHHDYYKIFYHIYDVQMPGPFRERLEILRSISLGPTVKLVDTFRTKKTTIDDYFDAYNDYEGLIIRHPEGPYEFDKRSQFLQKYKKFKDLEAQIIGITDGKGREEGCAVFNCRYEDIEFKVRPAMDLGTRGHIYRNRSDYIGRWCRVKYEKLSTNGIPLKPIAEAIFSGKTGCQ